MTPAEAQARAIYQGTHVQAVLQAKQRQLKAFQSGGLLATSPKAEAQAAYLLQDIATLEKRLAQLKRIAEGEAL